MPAKSLAPAVYQQLEDLNGLAITNGTVTVKETGTSVLATVYADADGLVVSANPLTVDGAGRWVLFLTPSAVYDFEFRDAHGALLKTVPEVQATPLATGNVDQAGTAGETLAAGQVVFLSDGNIATAGRWYLGLGATPYGYGASQPTIGMTVTGGGAGTTVVVRLAGLVTALAGLTVGAYYYVSNIPGGLSLTPGTYGRLVGQADTTTSLVLFGNPADPSRRVLPYVGTGAVAQLDPQGAAIVRLQNAAPLTIQGIKAGYEGQRVQFLAVWPNQVDFLNQSGAAAAVDRLWNWASSGPTSLLASGPGDGTGPTPTATYVYTNGAWRLVAHEQGAWITPPFVAGDYTGVGGMTWTVASGNVFRAGYRLSGRTLAVTLNIANATTIGGVASYALVYKIPGGYSCAAADAGACAIGNNGVESPNGIWAVTSTQIQFRTTFVTITNFTLGAANGLVLAATFEVT